MVIISSASHNNQEDSVFGLLVTSSPLLKKKNSPFLIEMGEKDFDGKLRYKSFVLTDVPYSTNISEVRGSFGTVSDEFYKIILERFKTAIQAE